MQLVVLKLLGVGEKDALLVGPQLVGEQIFIYLGADILGLLLQLLDILLLLTDEVDELGSLKFVLLHQVLSNLLDGLPVILVSVDLHDFVLQGIALGVVGGLCSLYDPEDDQKTNFFAKWVNLGPEVAVDVVLQLKVTTVNLLVLSEVFKSPLDLFTPCKNIVETETFSKRIDVEIGAEYSPEVRPIKTT